MPSSDKTRFNFKPVGHECFGLSVEKSLSEGHISISTILISDEKDKEFDNSFKALLKKQLDKYHLH